MGKCDLILIILTRVRAQVKKAFIEKYCEPAELIMVLCIVITYYGESSMNRYMVPNPARGQLNRENEFPSVPVRA